MWNTSQNTKLKKKRLFGSRKCFLTYFFDMNPTPSILIFSGWNFFMRPLIWPLFFALQHFFKFTFSKKFFCEKNFFGFFFTVKIFFVQQKILLKTPYIQKIRDLCWQHNANSAIIAIIFNPVHVHWKEI